MDYHVMWWVWSRPPQYWHEYRCYNINTQRRPRSKCLQNRVFQLKFGILSANIFTYFTEIRNLVRQYLQLTCLLIKMSQLIHPSSTAHHICIWCWMKTCKIAIFNNTQNKPYIFSVTVNNFYLDRLDCQKIFKQIRIYCKLSIFLFWIDYYICCNKQKLSHHEM